MHQKGTTTEDNNKYLRKTSLLTTIVFWSTFWTNITLLWNYMTVSTDHLVGLIAAIVFGLCGMILNARLYRSGSRKAINVHLFLVSLAAAFCYLFYSVALVITYDYLSSEGTSNEHYGVYDLRPNPTVFIILVLYVITTAALVFMVWLYRHTLKKGGPSVFGSTTILDWGDQPLRRRLIVRSTIMIWFIYFVTIIVYVGIYRFFSSDLPINALLVAVIGGLVAVGYNYRFLTLGKQNHGRRVLLFPILFSGLLIGPIIAIAVHRNDSSTLTLYLLLSYTAALCYGIERYFQLGSYTPKR